MRRQSLRPRQIDIHARMRIIRSQDDLIMDEEGANGAGSATTAAQPITVTFEELVASLDDHHQPVAQKLRRKKNIPIPVTLNVDSYEEEVKDDFEIPTSYVRFQNLPTTSSSSTELLPQDNKVEVDLDLDDMKWLKNHPKYGDIGDPRYQLTREQFAKMMDVLEKASALINPNVITLAEAEEVFAKQMNMIKTPWNKVTVDVYNYWVAKRTALKRPILRKYWPQTPLNDTNPHLVFRPREKERYKLRKHRKNDMEGYRKLQQLRADFERIRQMMELVKRREKCKRLAIDFLDEIRTQAVHELIHTNLTQPDGTVLVRQPKIPTEDDRERHNKKRKKKKKKHKKEHADGSKSSVIASETTAATSEALADALSDAAVRIKSFLEYDTSNNYKMYDDDHNDDPDQALELFPSYPMPTSHLMATIFMQPPKYRCRGRLGRGGRLIIDRIPVPPSRYYGPTEVPATNHPSNWTNPTTKRTTTDAQIIGSLANASFMASTAHMSVADALNATHHAAILVNEQAFRPSIPKFQSVTTTRLQEIYNMSDSEDEQLEPVTSSVFETPTSTSRKSSTSGSGGKSIGATVATDANRPTKFTLHV